MKLPIITLLILASCSIEKQPSADMKKFVGIWQDSPEIASGWSDTYQFFENGNFVYRYNQMVCDNRTLNYAGSWTVSGDKINNTVTEKTIIVGGKLVPSYEPWF